MRTKRLLLFAVFMLAAMVTFAQRSITVRGTVVEENGDVVIGATVKVKSTSIVAVTDMEGHFTLNDVRQGAQLEVTYVGMKPFTGTVKPEMKIVMYNDDSVLDEIVVTAFGEQKRSAFTGSAAVVDSKKFENKQLTNVLSGLQGEAAGVQMLNNSGDPGSSPTIRVRGFSSINAGQDPLIIVDGAPYDGGWSNINPADVASVTVLKDASSTALYGARGANGVIMITTKRSQTGDAVITFDAKWGANSRIKRDYETIKDPAQYYEYYYKALYNYQVNVNGLTGSAATAAANAQLTGNTATGGLGYIVYNVPTGELLIGEDGRLNPKATLGNQVTYGGNTYTIRPDNWEKEGFRNGFREEYNATISGGNDKLLFYASLGYLTNDGIVRNSDFNRVTTRFKADYQAKPWLRVGTNMNFTRSKYNSVKQDESGLFYQINNIAPIYPVYIRDANGHIMRDSNGKMYDYGDGAVIGLRRPVLPSLNPLQQNEIDTYKGKDNMFSVFGYADITPAFAEGLKVTVNGTATTYDTRSVKTSNPYYGFSSTLYPDGYISKTSSQTYSYNFQQLINYRREFGKHHAELLLGHEYYRYHYESVWGARTVMANYKAAQHLSAAVKIDNTGDSNSDYNSEGYFFRGQYDYDQKYFGSLSYRRDASSRFHPDHRWGDFYSIGGAWIISREQFMKDIKWVDQLKLKASFGQQGNDNIDNYLYVDTYSIVNNNNKVGLVLNTKGNPKITWETNNNFNIGVDFELFKSRLRGGIEYFYKKTTDMLCFIQAPYSAGYAGSYDNVGNLVNKGIEIDLSGTVIKTRDLTWDINFNTTHYVNKVTYLEPSIKGDLNIDGHPGYISGSYYYGEGLPLYTWYMKRYAGVSSDGLSQWYYTDSNGEMKTTTNYGDASFYLCGNPHPDLYGGFGTTLSLYGFDLSVAFSYSIGGKAYDYQYAGLMGNPAGALGGYSIHKDALKAWSTDNPNSNIPRWQYNDLNTGSQSDRFLLNASYLTFQNINLGYNLPKEWVNTLGLGSIRVYVAGDNLYYWSKRKGFDPRGSFSGGTSTTIYSPSRTVSGGVKLTF